jgi:phosphomannomutase
MTRRASPGRRRGRGGRRHACAPLPDAPADPVGAFAQKDLDAAACVVVTASHNPPADNGYKVYVEGAAQIVPPTDVAIAAAIDAVGPAVDVPRVDDDAIDSDPRAVLGDDCCAATSRRSPPRGLRRAAGAATPLRIAYTPLHGVGRDMVLRRSQRRATTTCTSRRRRPSRTASSRPSRSRTLRSQVRSMRCSRSREQVDADLVIANDPDADRLAIAVP